MYEGKLVFAQVMEHLPLHTLRRTTPLGQTLGCRLVRHHERIGEGSDPREPRRGRKCLRMVTCR
jgi:hypothetical protein